MQAAATRSPFKPNVITTNAEQIAQRQLTVCIPPLAIQSLIHFSSDEYSLINAIVISERIKREA